MEGKKKKGGITGHSLNHKAKKELNLFSTEFWRNNKLEKWVKKGKVGEKLGEIAWGGVLQEHYLHRMRFGNSQMQGGKTPENRTPPQKQAGVTSDLQTRPSDLDQVEKGQVRRIIIQSTGKKGVRKAMVLETRGSFRWFSGKKRKGRVVNRGKSQKNICENARV